MNLEPLSLETLQIITFVAGILALLALGLAVWALVRMRQGGGLSTRQRYEAVSRELESLREQHKLFTERIDRHERTHQTLRDEFSRARDEFAQRVRSLDDLIKTDHEQQEQIFELREEHKVLMQRDDRHERTLQELQAAVNTIRNGVTS